MKSLIKRIGDAAVSISVCSVLDILKILQGNRHLFTVVWLDAMHTEAIVSCCDGPEKAVNFFLETNSPFIPVQAITGDVAVVRFKEPVTDLSDGADPELMDISPQDIEDIEELLSEERQIELSLLYFLYGG